MLEGSFIAFRLGVTILPLIVIISPTIALLVARHISPLISVGLMRWLITVISIVFHVTSISITSHISMVILVTGMKSPIVFWGVGLSIE